MISLSPFHNFVSSRLSVVQHLEKSMFFTESSMLNVFVTSSIFDVHVYMSQ